MNAPYQTMIQSNHEALIFDGVEQVTTSVLFFLPFVFPVDIKNMNWTSAVVLGTLVLAGLNWVLGARHHYMGPVLVQADGSSEGKQVVCAVAVGQGILGANGGQCCAGKDDLKQVARVCSVTVGQEGLGANGGQFCAMGNRGKQAVCAVGQGGGPCCANGGPCCAGTGPAGGGHATALVAYELEPPCEPNGLADPPGLMSQHVV